MRTRNQLFATTVNDITHAVEDIRLEAPGYLDLSFLVMPSYIPSASRGKLSQSSIDLSRQVQERRSILATLLPGKITKDQS